MKYNKNIPFNKPYLSGSELSYIEDAVLSGKISGNGKYTKLCHEYFHKKYGFENCLLTTSCTDALEMAAILIDIQPGDEVIIPSFTFVSSANAFILRGAKVIFADSNHDFPNINENAIESLITEKTKAIVPVHYSGNSCNMDVIMNIANKYNIWVIEDAAQAIDSYYINSIGEKRPLGSIGHLSTFSFHETKNIISGEGGMLVVNDKELCDRAEIIWEKGTNRSAFFRGEIDKYGWVDIGSSYLPSEIIASFLYAQLQNLSKIQLKRKEIWEIYKKELNGLEKNGVLKIQKTPKYSTNNAHMFYLICPNLEFRDKLIFYLKERNIQIVFHYQSLHKSTFFKDQHDQRILENSDSFSDTLVRLPLFYELNQSDVLFITNAIIEFCNKSILVNH